MNYSRLDLPLLQRQSCATRLGQSTCPYCGVGCGVDVTYQQLGGEVELKSLAGTPEHPANHGRLCVKGTNLLETNSNSGRLLYPAVNGARANWQHASAYIADKIQHVTKQYGPDAVAFYVSGQLLTEDYYVANKLMKGFIGSANIDTNSRLCMSSAVAAYKRAFGEDLVPCCYEDLELTDLLVLVGSNAAWTHPVLFQRMERAKKRNPNMRIVVIDPRQTDSVSLADLHLPIRPGSDGVLFNGLLCYLAEHQALDQNFIAASTSGFGEALAAAKNSTPEYVASYCDISLAELKAFYATFTNSATAVTLFSMGINQSSSGVDKANAIINCHLASGKIGKPGSGPFSITGQPNAMGGREVGGLANMLAAHMDIDNTEHRKMVEEFWQAPAMASKPGARAVDMFAKMASGEIKFVWIMATNPVVSMPDREQIIAALKQCDTVVVSDIVNDNDTIRYADVVLPATGWSEKNGTVTNSERRISRQRGLMEGPGESRHDWQIICDVATQLGHAEAFNYQHVSEIFAEHARLTALNNNNQRALNLGGLSNLSIAQYDALRPIQWPVPKDGMSGTARLFCDGRYYTDDRKARFVPIVPAEPQQQTTPDYPFILNSGRVRDQWHTMTRTGKTSKLLAHTAQACLSVHPHDGAALNVDEGQLVGLSAPHTDAQVVLPVLFDERQRKGEVFAPIHWSATWGSHCAIGGLYNGAHDPISGQPELKQGAVALAPVHFTTAGQITTPNTALRDLFKAEFEYWVQVLGENCTSLTFASHGTVQECVGRIASAMPEDCEISTHQQQEHSYVLVTQNDKLLCYAALGTTNPAIPLQWLDSLFAPQESISPLMPLTTAALLRGEPDPEFTLGALICTCFGVRECTIIDAIEAGESSVADLGKKLKCGTNCGSCKSEIQRLLDQQNITPLEGVLL